MILRLHRPPIISSDEVKGDSREEKKEEAKVVIFQQMEKKEEEVEDPIPGTESGCSLPGTITLPGEICSVESAGKESEAPWIFLQGRAEEKLRKRRPKDCFLEKAVKAARPRLLPSAGNRVASDDNDDDDDDDDDDPGVVVVVGETVAHDANGDGDGGIKSYTSFIRQKGGRQECWKKCAKERKVDKIDKIGVSGMRETWLGRLVTSPTPSAYSRSSSRSEAAYSSSSSSSSSVSQSAFILLVEKMVVIAVLMTVVSTVTNIPVICAENLSFDKEIEPLFLEPVPNVTVAVGRDASLTCTVDHLGLHKVAWIHLDRQMIVSIHNHVITRQPRFTVTHDSHKTWTLQVTRVTEEDRGHYMCQVNTKPMISQTGYLQVVVPPNIVDKASSKSNIVVREKDNVTLVCRGEGFPLPQIKWRREDSHQIETFDGRKVHQLDGPKLDLRQVSRTHMGAYLCIATNGVPPSVSKRITLDVEFAPQMHVPNQLVGSPLGTEVRLECFVEAHPRAITYWEFLDSMVMNSSRKTTHTTEDRYKIHMTLTIRDLKDSDFGMYKCISKNSIAETDGSITLNKTRRPTSPPQTMLHGYEDEDNPYRNRGRQGRKEIHRKQSEDSRRRIQEEEEKRREKEEARRRAKETERQRLEHDFDRGQRNEQATRVTHTQSGSVSSLFNSETAFLTRCLLALNLMICLSHII